MNKLKKTIAIFLSLTFVIFTTACSNSSWSVKTADNTLPMGVYIYYMSTAYSEAYYKVANPYSGDILSQNVDDKNASDWIKDTAIDSCKRLLEVERRFKEAGLSLNDQELSAADSATQTQWGQYGKTYENFGISKESFHRASSLLSQQYLKLFDSIYSKEGTNPVSDEDLKTYFLDNYIDYSYISKSISSELSEEETSNIEKDFNSYLNSLNNGGSMKTVAETYKNKENLDQDPLVSDTSKIDENSNISEEISSALKEMSNNSSRVVKGSSSYYLLHKGDISSKLDMLTTDRESILTSMKSTEFSDMINSSFDSLEVTINTRAIKKYQPSLFVKKTSSK